MDKKLWVRHEDEVAELLDGYVHIGSGAIGDRGDISMQQDAGFRMLVENKATEKLSFSITKKLWRKIRDHAMDRSAHLFPAMAIRFYNPDHEGYIDHDLIILDLHNFLELINKLEQCTCQE